MELSRQEYWSGLPCPPPEDHPNPGMELASLLAAALAGGLFTTSATWRKPMSRDTEMKRSLTEGGKGRGTPGGGRPGVAEEEQTAEVSGAPACPLQGASWVLFGRQ